MAYIVVWPHAIYHVVVLCFHDEIEDPFEILILFVDFSATAMSTHQ
jgi:hypothetical protein